MNGSRSSPFKRMRTWSTLGCALALGLALSLWVGGHTLHGSLMLLGACALMPSSLLGRRARRHAQVDWPAPGHTAAAAVKPRRAA